MGMPIITKPPSRTSSVNDFANVFKAFIGSNYIGLPFAFMNSGIVLGIFGLLLIAILTDHCCQLIIKCKKYAVRLVLEASTSYRSYDNDDEQALKFRNDVERTMTYGDIGRIAMGRWGTLLVNISLFVTQFGFCIGYFIFIGNTLSLMFPMKNVNETLTLTSFYQVHNNSDSALSTKSSTGLDFYIESLKNTTNSITKQISTAPEFYFMALIPFPLIILLSFIKDVRKLGPISVLANISIFTAFLSVMVFMLLGLEIPQIHCDVNKLIPPVPCSKIHQHCPTSLPKKAVVECVTWATFPIFFGQVTSAYEGIGTLIPIESSMVGNRHRFPSFLHMALFGVSCILGSFGLIGYLRYGEYTPQIVTDMLPSGPLAQAVRITLVLGILFTYPMQLYPVVEIIEGYLFKDKKPKERSKLTGVVVDTSLPSSTQDSIQTSGYFDSKSCIDDDESSQSEDVNNEEEELINHTNQDTISFDVKYEPPTWQRNLLRIVLVLTTLGLGIIFKNDFAYISALTGSIGSSMLAYLLPCMFHLRLCKDDLPWGIVLKDILLIIFGIVGGCIGVVITIQSMIKKT